jgi:hypothetical protein
MKYLTVLVATFLICLLLPKSSYAQLVINEFSSYSSDDWVEVYLLPEETQSVQLSDYRIRDDTASNKIDLDGEIAPGEYKAFEFSNSLNKDKDNILLYKLVEGSEVQIGQISYGPTSELCAPEEGQSIGRKPDGGSFVRLSSQTKGIANSDNEAACPTPTPSPTPTPVPTDSPTPAPTENPTPKPTKSATPKPTNKVSTAMGQKITPTPATTIDILGGGSTPAVAGVESTENGTADDIKLTGEIPENAGLPAPAVAMIGGGVITVGAAGVSIWKNRYNEKAAESYNNEES